MNRDLQILKTGAAIFPIKTQRAEISEIKAAEIKEVEVSEARNLKTESRFARLKKNLRKRSHNIL